MPYAVLSSPNPSLSLCFAPPHSLCVVAPCRDLKPANLMIGGSHIESDVHRRLLLHELGTVKIADFGLSKSLKLHKQARSA